MTRRLPHLRALQRDEFREMASMVTITRPDGTVVAGTSPGDVTFDSEEVYDGRASVRRSDTATRTHMSATDSVTVAAYDVVVPRGTTIKRGDVVAVDACPDPAIVGLNLRVVDVAGGETSTNPRLRCEVAT